MNQNIANGIKVSIICATYNHEKYIRKALESFVAQKTNFPFEVIVHDDASTDKTAEIIKEFENKYPSIIKPIYQKENQWSKAKTMSKTFIWPKLKGEYVAICEGDDYWIDENKLQKQVDFLDSHLDYTICFHPVKVYWEDNRSKEYIYPNQKLLKELGDYSYKSLLKCNFIQTNSVLYRWIFYKEPYDLMPDHILPGDWFLHLLHAKFGKIGFLPEIMAVYRRNNSGIWTEAQQTPSWFCKCGIPSYQFWEEYEKTFNVSQIYEKEFTLYSTFYAALILNKESLISKFTEMKRPSRYFFINYIYLKILRFQKKYIHGDKSLIYKARYKSLKLYLKWKKNYKQENY